MSFLSNLVFSIFFICPYYLTILIGLLLFVIAFIFTVRLYAVFLTLSRLSLRLRILFVLPIYYKLASLFLGVSPSFLGTRFYTIKLYSNSISLFSFRLNLLISINIWTFELIVTLCVQLNIVTVFIFLLLRLPFSTGWYIFFFWSFFIYFYIFVRGFLVVGNYNHVIRVIYLWRLSLHIPVSHFLWFDFSLGPFYRFV